MAAFTWWNSSSKCVPMGRGEGRGGGGGRLCKKDKQEKMSYTTDTQTHHCLSRLKSNRNSPIKSDSLFERRKKFETSEFFSRSIFSQQLLLHPTLRPTKEKFHFPPLLSKLLSQGNLSGEQPRLFRKSHPSIKLLKLQAISRLLQWLKYIFHTNKAKQTKAFRATQTNSSSSRRRTPVFTCCHNISSHEKRLFLHSWRHSR